MIAPRKLFKQTVLSRVLSSAVLFPSYAALGLAGSMGAAQADDFILDGAQDT